MRGRAAGIVLLLLLPAGRLAGQAPAAAPGGVLRGEVRDSTTGLPVPYALVIWVERDNRLFTAESGRFTMAGLPSGRVTLRVQQIGYRATTLVLSLDTRSGEGGAPPVVVRIARQPVVLPTIVVEGSVCSGVEALAAGAEGGSILDQAFTNAERLLTLERSYPFRTAFQRVTTVLDTALTRETGWVDTVRYDTRRSVGYRKGKVLEPPTGFSRRELANYFTASDLANPEFRKSHCFWYGGTDSLQGFSGYRIHFAPSDDVRSVDWAGSLLIDSLTMTLLQSTARLVNLPPRGTIFASAECTVFYRPFAPTLVHEFQARCISRQRGNPPRTVVERWLLSEFTFLKRSPVDSVPP